MSEVRRKGNGEILRGDFQFYYSRMEISGKHEVGMI